jgi:hypothetical protein
MVTEADPRYEEFLERKPSAAKRKVNKLLAAPVAFVGAEIGKHAASRVSRNLPRAIRGGLTRAGELYSAAAAAGFAPLAGLTGAAIAAVLLQNKSVSDARLALGERVNALSRAFVAAQNQMAAEYRVAHFADVPAEARGRLLAGYKAALTAASQATVVKQGGRFGQIAYHTTGR